MNTSYKTQHSIETENLLNNLPREETIVVMNHPPLDGNCYVYIDEHGKLIIYDHNYGYLGKFNI